MRRSEWLSALAATDVYLKLETLQPSFSYKIRGAWNAALALQERGHSSPLVTASAGNHGRALAHAARGIGRELKVYVPANAPRLKVDAIRSAGATVHPCESYDEAERLAKLDARESGATYVSPYSDPDVIAGAGTVALEILQDLPDVETILVPVGGGGLISGVAIATEGTRASVTGVEAAASTPFTQGLRAGRIVAISVGPTLADGLAGNLDPETITFDIVRRLVRRIVVVSEDAIARAIRGLMSHERLVAEGAAATAIAAILEGCLQEQPRRTAVVLSGANIDPEKLKTII